MCNFTQDADDDFDWTRNQGDTRTDGTGPEQDDSAGKVPISSDKC